MKATMCLTKAEIIDRLKAADILPTVQRISIAQYVLCEADHPTAEDVHAWAEKNLEKISLATVYNTLNALVIAGLLKEYRFGHTDKLIYDPNIADHYHFFDEKSGKLMDLSPDDIDISVNLKKQFEVSGVDILLRGQYKKA